MTTALPPSIQHTSHPISPATALTSLTAFLSTANDTAAYRPDSVLSPRGPISSSTQGTQNLVLHHLNRIKLGLEGIRVGAAELAAEDAAAQQEEEEERAAKRTKREPFVKTPRVLRGVDRIPVVTTEEPTIRTEEEGGEWEDKDDYELAQDEENVEMNAQRDPAGGLEQSLSQPADAQEAAEMMEIEETQVPLSAQESEKTGIDKEERKRLKKLKQKQEKQKAEAEGKARSKKDSRQSR